MIGKQERILNYIVLFALSAALLIQPVIYRFLPARDLNLMINASIRSTWANIITLIALFTAAFLFLVRISMNGNRGLLSIRRFAFPAIFLIFAILSLAYTVDIHASVWEIIRLLGLMGVITIISGSMNEKPELKGFVDLMLSIGLIAALYGILQYFFIYDVIQDMFKKMSLDDPRLGWGLTRSMIDQKRAVSFLDWPNMLSGFLALFIPLSISLAIFNKGRARAGYAVISAVMLLCMVLTFSIGGFLALLAALALECYMLRGIWKRRIIKISFTALVILLAAVCAVVLFHKRSNPITAASVTGRISYQKAAVDMIRDHPFKGTGIGTFAVVYPKYMVSSASSTIHAHNTYLEIFSELGILGLLALLILFAWILRAGSYLARETKDGYRKFLSIGLTCGIFSFMAHNLIEFTYYHQIVSLFWWASVGVLIKIYIIEREYSAGRPSDMAGHALTTAPALLLTVFIIVYLARAFSAESHLARAVDMGLAGDLAGSRRELKESARLDGINPAYYMLLGETEIREYDRTRDIRHIDAALSFYDKSLSLSSHLSEGYYGRALAYFRAGDLNDAKSDAIHALSLNRTSNTYRGFIDFLNKQ